MRRELRRQTMLAKADADESAQPKTMAKILDTFRDEAEPSEVDCFDVEDFQSGSVYAAVVADVSKAIEEFVSKNQLEVLVVTEADKIPSVPNEFEFSFTPGQLDCCASCVRKGQFLTIAAVKEDGLVIGYGIAQKLSEHTRIDAIDVDRYSRRRSGGFGHKFDTQGKTFEVGVGHAVVKALIEACPRPLHTNATHGSSIYLFQSLGFSAIATRAPTEGVELELK